MTSGQKQTFTDFFQGQTQWGSDPNWLFTHYSSITNSDNSLKKGMAKSGKHSPVWQRPNLMNVFNEKKNKNTKQNMKKATVGWSF